eukprot:g11900.t1
MSFLFKAVDKLGEVADQFADKASELLDIDQESQPDEIGRILHQLRFPQKWLFGIGELRAYVETYPKAVEALAVDPARVKLLGQLLFQIRAIKDLVVASRGDDVVVDARAVGSGGGAGGVSLNRNARLVRELAGRRGGGNAVVGPAELVQEYPWARIAIEREVEEEQRLRLEGDLVSVIGKAVRFVADTRKEDRAYFFEVLVRECGDALMQILDVQLLLTLGSHSHNCATTFGKELFRKEPEYLTRLLRACDVGLIPHLSTGDADDISRRRRDCFAAVALLRMFLTHSPDMCSGAVFEEGVDILLRGVDETHAGQQFLLNNEEPAILVLSTLELVIREGKEVSRRYIRQQQETADALLLAVENADVRVFAMVVSLAELFHADSTSTTSSSSYVQLGTTRPFGTSALDEVRKFSLRFVPMLSAKMATFRAGDDLLLRCTLLVAKLVGGDLKVLPGRMSSSAPGPVAGSLLGGRKDSNATNVSETSHSERGEDSVLMSFGGGSDAYEGGGDETEISFEDHPDTKYVYAHILGGQYASYLRGLSKTRSAVCAYYCWCELLFDELVPVELRVVVLENLVVRFPLPAEFLVEAFSSASSGIMGGAAVVVPCGKQVTKVLTELERCDLDTWFRRIPEFCFAVEWVAYVTGLVSATAPPSGAGAPSTKGDKEQLRKKFTSSILGGNRAKLLDKIASSLRWAKLIVPVDGEASAEEHGDWRRFPVLGATSTSNRVPSKASASAGGPASTAAVSASAEKQQYNIQAGGSSASSSSQFRVRDFSARIQQEQQALEQASADVDAAASSSQQQAALHSSQTAFALQNVLKVMFLASVFPEDGTLARELANSPVHLPAVLGLISTTSSAVGSRRARLRSGAALVLGSMVCKLQNDNDRSGSAAASGGGVSGRQLMELITNKIGLEDFNHFLRQQNAITAVFSGSGVGSTYLGGNYAKTSSTSTTNAIFEQISRAMVAVYISDESSAQPPGAGASGTATSTTTTSGGLAASGVISQNLLRMQEAELQRFSEENRQLRQEVERLQAAHVDREKLSLTVEIDGLKRQARNLQVQCDLHLVGYLRLEEEHLAKQAAWALREDELTGQIKILCLEVEQLRRDLLEARVENSVDGLTSVRSAEFLGPVGPGSAKHGSFPSGLNGQSGVASDAGTTLNRVLSDDERTEFTPSLYRLGEQLNGAAASGGPGIELSTTSTPKNATSNNASKNSSDGTSSRRTPPRDIDTSPEMIDAVARPAPLSRTIEELRSDTPLRPLTEAEVEERLSELRELITVLHDQVPETRKFMAPVADEAIAKIASKADAKYHLTLGNCLRIAGGSDAAAGAGGGGGRPGGVLNLWQRGSGETAAISEREEFLLSSFFKQLFDRTKLDRRAFAGGGGAAIGLNPDNSPSATNKKTTARRKKLPRSPVESTMLRHREARSPARAPEDHCRGKTERSRHKAL